MRTPSWRDLILRQRGLREEGKVGRLLYQAEGMRKKRVKIEETREFRNVEDEQDDIENLTKMSGRGKRECLWFRCS